MMKKLGSKLAYILIGIILAIAGTVYAYNVSVPQAQQKGDVPCGQLTGNYSLLHPGSDGLVLTASSTAPCGLVYQTASSTGGTGISSLNGLVGASQTFATGSVTGLDVGVNSSGSTHTITPLLQAGYGIPLTASTTNWNNLYNNLFTRQVISTTSSGTVFYVTTSSPGNITINFPPNLLTTTSAASLYYLQTNPSSYISLGSLSGTAPITYNNSTGAFGCTTSSSGVTGCLSGTDWTTFNGKQAAGNYITALTGDVTATGPGSVATTLATVNTNTGSFGSSTAIPNFTVNGKGLITAAGTNVVIAPAGTLTGTTLASNVLSSSLTSVGTLSALTVTGQTALANASTTNLSVATNLWLNGLTNTILAVDPNGKVIATTTSAGGVTAVNGSGSILSSGGSTPTIQLQNLTANNILFGQGTNVIGTSSSFTYNGTNLVVAGGGVFATSSSVTNASTTNLTATNFYLTGATTGCATFTGQILSSTGVACGSGGGGLGAGWATSSPNIVYNNFGTVVGINSTTPTANLVAQGISGSTTPIFIAASSTGANYLSVDSTGSITMSKLGSGFTLPVKANGSGQLSTGFITRLSLGNPVGILIGQSSGDAVLNSIAPVNNGQLLMGSSTEWTLGSLVAGSNITITTSTQGQIIIASTGSLSGGTNGQLPYWTSASALSSTATVLYNGTVFGMNATSSTIGFNIQGTAGTNTIFNVASSSGTSYLSVSPLGVTTIANLTLGTPLTQANGGTGTTTPYMTTGMANIASTSILSGLSYGSATTTAILAGFPSAVTLKDMRCTTKSGTVTLAVGNGSATSTVICSTSGANNPSANVSFSANQDITYQLGSSSSGDFATFRLRLNY